MFRLQATRPGLRLIGLMALLSALLMPAVAQATSIGVSKTRADGYTGIRYVGDIDAFRVLLTNNNDAGNITNVSFTDNMPAGFRVAGGRRCLY